MRKEIDMLMKIYVPILTFGLLLCAVLLCFGDGDREIAEDQRLIRSNGLWIYNDLAEGFEQAEETGKPLLIVFR